MPASVAAISATTLTCSSGQVNVGAASSRTTDRAQRNLLAVRARPARRRVHDLSDLGNISTYTDGQTWTTAGSCVAGSSRAPSAPRDRAQRPQHSGLRRRRHFLSPGGDKTINRIHARPGPRLSPFLRCPRRCLLSKHRRSRYRNAAGEWRPGVRRWYHVPGHRRQRDDRRPGLAAAPVKDAAGFYHFKPSCYGYLDLGALRPSISNVQAGPVVTAKHFITQRWRCPARGTPGGGNPL